MASNSESFDGGCTCRHVRYRLTSKPMFVHGCHCRWCQRETGTAHALNAVYEADRVIHIAAEPEIVVTPSASGKGQRVAVDVYQRFHALQPVKPQGQRHINLRTDGAVLSIKQGTKLVGKRGRETGGKCDHPVNDKCMHG